MDEIATTMKTYEDRTISLVYPDDFKLQPRKNWGQYSLKKKLGKKKEILVFVQIVSEEMLDSFERVVRGCPFDEYNVGKTFESVKYGQKEGVGHVVVINNLDHNFIQKR